ncbi:hypothetical protein V7S43_010039 [Phytophthora oleae]|uniref:Uncharacterized protein n=1 Tax=Phytophthora oleae TaxID=2107226 RepID=A0ABD3FF12_9STRA
MVGTRGTAPRGDAAAVPDAERNSQNFKLIWTQYKKLGWTSKAPSRGIETRWKYILPGANANGTVGIDYLLGEQAVVNYAVQQVQQETIARVQATAASEAAKATEARAEAATQPPPREGFFSHASASAAPPKSPEREPSVTPSAWKPSSKSPKTQPSPNASPNTPVDEYPACEADAGLAPSSSPALTTPIRPPALTSPALASPKASGSNDSANTTAGNATTATRKKHRGILVVEDDDSEDESKATGPDEGIIIFVLGRNLR